MKPQPTPLFFVPPRTLSLSHWKEIASACERMSFSDLCLRAGVQVRLSGPFADRDILFVGSKGEDARQAGNPQMIMIAEDVPHTRKQALMVLARLAYGFNDYGARECVCGRGLFQPSPGPGRPRKGQALSGAERVRRLRARRLHSPDDLV